MDPLRSTHTSSPGRSAASIPEFILHDDDADDKDSSSLADSSLSSSQCSTCCVNAEATLHRCDALAHENKLLHADAIIVEYTNEDLLKRIDKLEEKIEGLEMNGVQHQTHFAELAGKCVTLGLEKAGQEDQIVRLSTELRDASRDHDNEVDELRMQIGELQQNLRQERERRQSKEKLQLDYLRMCRADAIPRTTRSTGSTKAADTDDATIGDTLESSNKPQIERSVQSPQPATMPAKAYGRPFPFRLYVGLDRSQGRR